MTSDLLLIHEEEAAEQSNSITNFRPLQEQPNYLVQYLSPVFVKIQQLKADVNENYQYEKNTLGELNEQLCIMIDRARDLESQNAEYLRKILDSRYRIYIANIKNEQDSSSAELDNWTSVHCEKATYESEADLHQLETQMYQQMIEIQLESTDKERVKLEEILNQTSLELATLRASHETLLQDIETSRVTREDTWKEYMKLAQEWSLLKKQIKDLKINAETIRTQIQLCKTLPSYVLQLILIVFCVVP